MFVDHIISKWCLRSDCPLINAYNAKLYKYLTENNRWFNFKQAKNKIIAANYYILSVMQEKYENYPEAQQHDDLNFLDKVMRLHSINAFEKDSDNLMNVKWSSLRKKRGC